MGINPHATTCFIYNDIMTHRLVHWRGQESQVPEPWFLWLGGFSPMAPLPLQTSRRRRSEVNRIPANTQFKSLVISSTKVISVFHKELKFGSTFSRDGLASLKSRTTRARAAVIAVQDMFKPISRDISIPSVIE